MAVSFTFGPFAVFLTTISKAFLSSDASFAAKNWPPVFLARHCNCVMPILSLTSKPTTWAVKSTPAFSKSFPTAHGSALQVSLPSLMSITVAFSSLYFSSLAATRTAWVRGVLPLGLIAFMVFMNAPGFTFETEMRDSISLQSPFLRWPYAVRPR